MKKMLKVAAIEALKWIRIQRSRNCQYSSRHGSDCVVCPRCKIHMTAARAAERCAFLPSRNPCPFEPRVLQQQRKG